MDGKDTLHDTVGIIYQDEYEIVPENEENTPISNNGTTTISRKRKRTLDAVIDDVQPYVKKIKYHGTLLPCESLIQSYSPSNLQNINLIDRSWMISHFLEITTPMWVGYNAKIL